MQRQMLRIVASFGSGPTVLLSGVSPAQGALL